MIDFLKELAPLFYAFLVITSILFGITQAVNIWLLRVIKSLRKDTDNNFVKYLSNQEINKVNLAIKSAKIEYSNYLFEVKKIKKIKSKNKIRKFFKLKEIIIEENVHNIKESFINFIKNVYGVFSSKEGEGYLTFSKNQLFSILNTLTFRIDEILSNSKVSFIKYIKVSLMVEGIEMYLSTMKFFEKIWVVIIMKTINFFLLIGRVFSPVALSKYYVKNLSSQGLETIIYETVVEIIGKELAVIYKKEKLVEKSNNKNIKTAV